jgi:hypothetical protein
MSNNFDFLHPRSRYYGEVKPENMVFNANLQEFANRVTFIASLNTNGKLPPAVAYKEIKGLWKQLKRSKKQLGIGSNSYE